jgi:DNA-binding CsgD family transcriptional regulator
VVWFVGVVGASPYEAFACLPDREKYQSTSEIERRLSYDIPAVLALCAACKNPSTERGAWNLLLLALGRSLGFYMKRDELGDLIKWICLAIERGKHPISIIRCYSRGARLSREADERRTQDWMQLSKDSGALILAYEGENDLVWSVAAPDADYFLREKLESAIAKLTKKEQAVFLLSSEGFTCVEIGQLLKTSEGAARNLLSTAKKKLRELLKKLDPGKR